MGTSAERSSQNTQYFTRGDQIPGLQVGLRRHLRVIGSWSCVGPCRDLSLTPFQVNAMDILAVKQATAWAREWTLSGKGPLVLELVTYRYGGHS
jgi:pyruvate dehydrogenase E1 component alpha subunit